MSTVEPAQVPPAKPLASWYAQGLSDALGDRLLMYDNSGAPSLELLRFHPHLAQVPGFERALRERVERLSQFRHPAFAEVRSVKRLEPDDDLALVSNCTPGKRLSEVLHRAHGPEFAAALIRQLAPALVLLQQHEPGISHGVLSPDRIVVSPEGRLTIVEHVLGPAIDALALRTDQLASLGIAVPPATEDSTPGFDVAADWYQLALVAVSVLIGRPVATSELPQLETLLDRAGHSTRSDGSGLSPAIRQWLNRALQISGNGIKSGADARAALDDLLQGERSRGSRRIDPVRRTPDVPSAPSPAIATEPLAYLTPEVAARPVAVVTPTRHVTGNSAPKGEPSSAASGAMDSRHRALDVRTLFSEEPVAAKGSYPGMRKEVTVHAPAAAKPARQRVVSRRMISVPVAILALIAGVEAGVIARLSRALWLAPHPAIVVETPAGGDGVLVSSRSTEAAPLRLTVAPDLRWVRVTSPSSAGVLGAKVTAASAGTIRIASPIELKVFEESRLLGSVPSAGLSVPAGRHNIELVNAALGYRSRQVLDVEAGQTVSITVAPLPGWLTIDASPWADVAIDGQVIGRTPLGPLPISPGEHLVTFRHPTGGSDRQRVTVKSEAKMRVVGILRP